MNYFLRATILAFIILLSACDAKDCLDIASDQLKLSDSIEYDGKEYLLYTRTSGWQEKIVYLELYEKEPTYDRCTNKTSPEPIFGIHYDYFPNDPKSVEKYVEKVILQPASPEKLKIIYTEDINKGTASIYDVKFTQ